jgi:hypothetical protein
MDVVWRGQVVVAGLDDFGKAAAGGPFRVRVRLGLTPEFGGFVMYNRDGSAVAVGPAGTLYVFHKDGWSRGRVSRGA